MRQVIIRVVTRARHQAVTEEDGSLRVSVTAPPAAGKANTEVIALLAAFFHVRKGAVRIVKGHRSRDKVVEIH